MDILNVESRYTRADLLALRYEESARQRPNCANRIDLQTLNFWKISGYVNNSGGNNVIYAGKASSSPDRERDRDRDNSSLSSSNSLISSRRAMRNRERAHNYYQRFSSSDQIGGEEPGTSSPANSNTPLKSSNLIDHRSISSSHLMPAFAKRRFVIASGNGSSELTDPEKPVEDDRSDNRRGNFHAMRSSNNLLSSPIRIGEPIVSNEWERSDKHTNLKDLEQSSASSPTYVSGRQSSERRIGSGRLLPRNDNWEYNKNQDTNRLDIDKLQNGSIMNQQRQRTYSGKQGERLGFNINNDHVREPIEVKRNNVQSGGRRTANKDKFNFSDSSNLSRGRRGLNSYQMHDRHEPEWFSAGPTSQLETIDLHGFDDSEEETVSPLEADEATIATSAGGQSRSSSVGSLTKVKLHGNKKDYNEQTNSQGQQVSGNSDSKSEAEFNFEVYLNMDPMEHSLMGNDSKAQSDNSGTSRFSQWFETKESANNNKPLTQDSQEIPSVKDLEAQMTKVDLRIEYGGKPCNSTKENVEQKTEKMITRDTEAFKKLLEQLGSQKSQPADESYNHLMTNSSNISTVRVAHRPPNMLPQHIGRVFQESQPKEDDIQQSINQQQRNKKHDVQINLQQPQLQNQLHPAYVQDSNLSGHLSLHDRKRMEAQHLLQSVLHGDISLETLEKELNNPNVAAQSREVIANVLYECSNNGRNVIQQKLNYSNGIQNTMKMHPLFNKNTVDEMFTQHTPPIQGIGQQLRHTISPTPLAFTPTSVLRKMTADKETTSSNTNFNIHNAQKKPVSVSHNNMLNDPAIMSANSGINLQPRMILGGNYSIQQQQQHPLNTNNPQVATKLQHPQLSQVRCQPQVKWSQGGNMSQAKSFGRPILKGTLNSAGSQPQMAAVMAFPSSNEMQQLHHQQRIKSVQAIESINNDPIIHNAPYHDGISQIQHHHYLHHQQQQQQQQQQQHQPRPLARYRLVQGHNNTMVNAVSTEGTDKNCLSSMNYHRGGGDTIDRLSPTTNQLAQWFSPELLARASAGKLPLLNMDQALSLEEFERSMQHSSAKVLK